jgi:hypothetical protein
VRTLLRLFFSGVLSIVVVMGCSTKKAQTELAYDDPGRVGNSAAGPRRLIVTPASGSTGKVAMVNNAARFVVLNYPLGHLPANNQHLNVYRRGLKVGEIKITNLQNDDNVVADLVAGECEIGDEARE